MNQFHLTRQQVIDIVDKFNKVSIGYVIEVDDLLASLSNVMKYRDIEKLSNMMVENNDVILSISQLKKRIKYCRNPMEKKKLQQELNMAYKEQKRRGK